MSDGIQQTPRTRGAASPGTLWWRRNGVVLVAAALLVVGAVVFLLAPTTVPVYGWTAYAPLSPGVDFLRTSYLTPQHIVGAALVVLGLVLMAGAVGFRLGRRRAV
jgi:heme/copper-type cytochrome/quinol oxidase subunit 1